METEGVSTMLSPCRSTVHGEPPSHSACEDAGVARPWRAKLVRVGQEERTAVSVRWQGSSLENLVFPGNDCAGRKTIDDQLEPAMTAIEPDKLRSPALTVEAHDPPALDFITCMSKHRHFTLSSAISPLLGGRIPSRRFPP